jgi:hypothetical protein
MIEQMMEGLLAKMDISLKKIRACQKHLKEGIRSGPELQKEKNAGKIRCPS